MSKPSDDIKEVTAECVRFHNEEKVPAQEQANQYVQARFGKNAQVVEYELGEYQHWRGESRGPFSTAPLYIKYRLT